MGIELGRKIVKANWNGDEPLPSRCCFDCCREIPQGTKIMEITLYDNEDECTYMRLQCIPCGRFIAERKKDKDWVRGRTFPGAEIMNFIFGNQWAKINEVLYWRCVKYFGYGGDKWE